MAQHSLTLHYSTLIAYLIEQSILLVLLHHVLPVDWQYHRSSYASGVQDSLGTCYSII